MQEFIFSIFEHQFMTNAVLAALLSAFACGITGTFVVVKRVSYIGGGIAHAVLGGLGIAYFLNVNPIYGALVFAVFAAFILTYVKLKFKENEDTIISALWSVGMAVGIIFAYLTPGYGVDLLSFLFGNILMVSNESLVVLLVLDLFIIGVVSVLYNQLVFTAFDEEYAAIRGVNVGFITLTLYVIIALTIVILIQTVGLIMVIALLTLPSSIARMFSHSIVNTIAGSVILIVAFNLLGLYTAYEADLPSGASVILITGISYLIAFIVKQKFKKA